MTDEQIKHMVNRFLQWRLPQPWYPDAGVSFKPSFAEEPMQSRHWPVGTNLFSYTQSEAMVRHMVSGVISPEWCINMAKQEGDGDIAAGVLAIDPSTAICSNCQQSGWDCGCADDDVLYTFPALTDNFHKLPENESFERVARVAKERQAFNEHAELKGRKAIVAWLRKQYDREIKAMQSKWS